MQKDHIIIERKMAGSLLEAEVAVDSAFRSAAELAAYMPEARSQARVSAELGHSAFEHVTATMQELLSARRQLIETHRALADAQDKVGLRPRNFGGFVDKPSTAKIDELIQAVAA